MSHIILFRGKPGVGKTTLSTAVATQLGIGLLHKDDIYDSLYDSVPDHQSRNAICETIIKKLLHKHILLGADIILDHSLHYPDHIHGFQTWVKNQGGHLVSMLVICSDENIWKARFEQRKLNPAPNQQITDFEALRRHYGSLHTEPLEEELVLDSIEALPILTDKAIKWIQTF